MEIKCDSRKILCTWLRVKIAMLCTFVSVFAAAESRPTLEWCVDHIPVRHEFTKQGLQGPTVQFMQEVARRVGFTLSYSPNTPFQRCLKNMREGSSDIMMALIKSDDREAYMTMLPVYKSRSETLFATQQNSQLWVSKDSVRALKLGIVNGYEIKTSDWVKLKSRNSIVNMDSVDDGLALLFHNHIDVIVAPHYSTLFRINNNPRFKDKILPLPIKLNDSSDKYAHFAFSKESDVPPQLVKKTSEVIEQMVASGEAYSLLLAPLDGKKNGERSTSSMP